MLVAAVRLQINDSCCIAIGSGGVSFVLCSVVIIKCMGEKRKMTRSSTSEVNQGKR